MGKIQGVSRNPRICKIPCQLGGRAKLIFLLLLTVIVIYADLEVQRMSLLALAVATGSFFWRLFPLIRNMDRNGQIEPRNYSKVLGIMIMSFIGVFVLAAVL